MSKLGKRLITAAKEARAIARGEADPKTYRIHVPAEIDVTIRAAPFPLLLEAAKRTRSEHQ